MQDLTLQKAQGYCYLLTANSLLGVTCGKQKRAECTFLMLILSLIFTLSGSFSLFMKYFSTVVVKHACNFF